MNEPATEPTAYQAAYCPRCGTETGTKVIDDAERCWCPECDVVHWRAAVPVIGVAVVEERDGSTGGGPAEGDESATILCFYHERTGLWDLPSGHQELPEGAPETAARELEEETNLVVDPDDLDLVDVTVKQHPLGRYNFSTTYRTTRDCTTGTIEPEFPDDEVGWFTASEATAAADEFVPGVPELIGRLLEP